MKINVEDIKKQFPNPGNPKTTGVKYCIGGALISYLKFPIVFPTVSCLREILIRVNENLSFSDTAYGFAEEIIKNNDEENFAVAWDYLRQALEYGLKQEEYEPKQDFII